MLQPNKPHHHVPPPLSHHQLNGISSSNAAPNPDDEVLPKDCTRGLNYVHGRPGQGQSPARLMPGQWRRSSVLANNQLVTYALISKEGIWVTYPVTN